MARFWRQSTHHGGRRVACRPRNLGGRCRWRSLAYLCSSRDDLTTAPQGVSIGPSRAGPDARDSGRGRPEGRGGGRPGHGVRRRERCAGRWTGGAPLCAPQGIRRQGGRRRYGRRGDIALIGEVSEEVVGRRIPDGPNGSPAGSFRVADGITWLPFVIARGPKCMRLRWDSGLIDPSMAQRGPMGNLSTARGYNATIHCCSGAVTCSWRSCTSRTTHQA